MDVPACQGCAALMQHLEQLQTRVAQLEAELAAAKKNSSNSSKPPSSDFVKKPKDKPKDGKKRKRGGQPGHPRHERPLLPDDRVDDRFEFMPVECPDCHGPVVASKQPPKIVQQIELPMPAELVRVVEYRLHACWCRKCRQVHYAPRDAATQQVGVVGPRLTALIAYLKGACHASFSTIRKFIRDVLQITISR